MRVQLRQAGQDPVPADVDLEEEVRAGRLFAEDEVAGAPVAGPGFVRLGDLAWLRAAFDAPDARFAAWVRARRFPWGTLALFLVVGVAGALQSAGLAGKLPPTLAEVARQAVVRGALGYEPFLLDGAWWAPWTSQLVHAGVGHLLANLPVLAYSGFRVERALGRGGLAVVVSAAVLGGALLVTGFGTLPVVGASIAAYGLWGAQIAIGFRVGPAMPPGWRGFYGWGNLVLFVPLYLAGLGAEGVSHLGHLGGLLGGVAAALLVPAESFVPRGDVSRRRRANLAIAGVLAATPMLAGAALARVAPALALPSERVEVPAAGASLELPWRMAANPVRFARFPAWIVSGNHEEPIFCGLTRLPSADEPPDALYADAWREAFGAEIEAGPPPPPLRPGWTGRSWLVRDAEGVLVGRVVEQDLRRGAWLLRAGYHLRVDDEPGAAREAVYQHALETLAIADPPALAEARRAWERDPDDPGATWTYARELGRAGEGAEADALWVELAARPDGWAAQGALGRIEGWLEAEDGAAGATVEERAAWVRGCLARAPQDAGLRAAAEAWLEKEGRCGGGDASGAAACVGVARAP